MKEATVEIGAPPGLQLAGYDVLEAIGEGGFGTVYKARQHSTGQLVAIKSMRLREEQDAQRRKQLAARFERETTMCAEINHPHIVQLIDKGQDADGTPFAVYEYVAGETLKDHILRQGSLTATETAELMGQVLDALCCAHGLGIVHRDLKPQNIMVTQTGSRPHAKVLDFGIGGFTHDARHLDYRSLTLTQEVLGTPTYCAPEQLRGEPITLKSDLYAWGLILIECLTGQPVMQGNSVAEVFEQQLSASNVPLPPSISGHPLADLLRRVLEKNPRQRLGEAARVLEEFGKVHFASLVGKIQPHAFTPQGTDEDVTGLNAHSRSNRVSERKQITVLCIKISLQAGEGSVLDLETLETLQKDQLNLCKDTASRFGGHIAGSLADNVVVYFGYPQTSDTDARRAGRTALELMNQAQRRSALLLEKHGIALRTCMSMHTGTVLAHPTRTPEGLVPNTAFDLLYRAEHGSVLVSEVTQKLLDPYLEFEVGAATAAMSKTYLLVGERQTEAMSFLRPSSADRDMVGREAEREQVYAIWADTQASSGKAILVQGQAGIGKSKLVFEAKKQVRNEGFVVRECRCLPEHQNNALYAFTDMLRRHFGIHEGGDAAFAFEKLEASVLQAGLDAATTLPILCAWLNLPLAAGYAPSLLPPDQQKLVLFDCLKKLIGGLGQGEKFLLVVEDLHWIDPTGQEFLAELVASAARGNALILMTARPEYEAEWGAAHFAHIDLNPLEIQATKALVEAVLQGKSIADKALAYINDKGDGVPLYIEEFTATLLERNFLVLKDGVYDLIDEIEEQSIPETLSDLLNARLDRLGYAKETAQLAATIGREFNYDLLAKASLRDEAAVQSDLESLLGADLIYQQRRVQGDGYVFRHALIRDAAYDGMGSLPRKEHHLRIAETLKASFPEVVEENPFEVGRHLAGGGEYEEGSEFGIKAVEKQVGNSANEEAIRLAETLRQWIGEINDESLMQERTIILNTSVIPALMSNDGYANDNILKLNKQNEEYVSALSQANIDISHLADQTFRITYDAFLYHHTSANRRKAAKLREEVLESLSKNPDRKRKLGALGFIGQSLHLDGRIDEALEIHKWILANYDDEKDINLASEYGIDPKVCALMEFFQIGVSRSGPETSLKYAQECFDHAHNKTKHDLSKDIAYTFLAIHHNYAANYDETKALAKDYEEAFSFRGEKLWVNQHFMMCVHSAARQIEFPESYVEKMLSSGQISYLSYFEPMLALAYIDLQQPAKGSALMRKSIERCEDVGEFWTLPYLRHTLAKAQRAELQGQYTQELDNILMQAYSETEHMKMNWWGLEIALSIALWKGDRALDIDFVRLRTAIGKVSEGFETSTYQSAVDLLAKNE